MQEISVTDIEMDKEPFARGGFGKVYMAKWRKKEVVVKIIRADNDEMEQAVKNETNLTLHLRHRNVIAVSYTHLTLPTKRIV